MKFSLRSLALLTLSAVPAALAQDRGQLGVDVAVGGATSQTIGVTYHVTGRVALRPTFAVNRVTSRDAQVYFSQGEVFEGSSETTSNGVAAGLQGLLYLTRKDSLASYLTASYQRQHTSQETQPPQFDVAFDLLPPLIQELATFSNAARTPKQSTNSNLYGAAFGLQYALGTRFSAFGEVGLRYSTTRSKVTAAPLPDYTSGGRGFGAVNVKQLGSFTSSFGVIFYFK
jgi:hypothetical protein